MLEDDEDLVVVDVVCRDRATGETCAVAATMITTIEIERRLARPFNETIGPNQDIYRIRRGSKRLVRG